MKVIYRYGPCQNPQRVIDNINRNTDAAQLKAFIAEVKDYQKWVEHRENNKPAWLPVEWLRVLPSRRKRPCLDFEVKGTQRCLIVAPWDPMYIGYWHKSVWGDWHSRPNLKFTIVDDELQMVEQPDPGFKANWLPDV